MAKEKMGEAIQRQATEIADLKLKLEHARAWIQRSLYDDSTEVFAAGKGDRRVEVMAQSPWRADGGLLRFFSFPKVWGAALGIAAGDVVKIEDLPVIIRDVCALAGEPLSAQSRAVQDAALDKGIAFDADWKDASQRFAAVLQDLTRAIGPWSSGERWEKNARQDRLLDKANALQLRQQAP